MEKVVAWLYAGRKIQRRERKIDASKGRSPAPRAARQTHQQRETDRETDTEKSSGWRKGQKYMSNHGRWELWSGALGAG
jgi:hypothetical protein